MHIYWFLIGKSVARLSKAINYIFWVEEPNTSTILGVHKYNR